MQEREEFYAFEELLKPMETFTANTGEGEIVERTIEKLFNSVLRVLGYNEDEIELFVERKSKVLHSYDTAGVLLPTDDRVTYLVARGSVVASVCEIRNDFNYIQVCPASYINKEMIKGIGEKHKV